MACGRRSGGTHGVEEALWTGTPRDRRSSDGTARVRMESIPTTGPQGTLTDAARGPTVAEADAVTVTAIVGAATGLVSLIVMALKIRMDEKQIDTLQDLAKSLTSVVSSYDREVASLRRDVEAFRTLMGTPHGSDPAKADRDEPPETSEEREDAWRRMREIAKALGWARPGPPT